MRVLFVINNMKMGGIQKSLLELLKALSHRNDLSITLFCCKVEGDYLDSIPSNVTVLPENRWARLSESPLHECKKYGISDYLIRLSLTIWTKMINKKQPAELLCKLIGNLGVFDTVISFSQPIEEHSFAVLTNEIALRCFDSRLKVTYVHCDYSSYGGNCTVNHDLYSQFDRIAAVSDSVGNVFKECNPDLQDKVFTAYNFIDIEEIKNLAFINPVVYHKPSFITIARLSKEKGIERCIPIFERIKNDGLEFEWHIIGDGPLYTSLNAAIRQLKLDDCILLEGKQSNPYRYLLNADYLLVPSYHEAAPLVFDEAKVLNVPILTTNTLSADELVNNLGAGLVSAGSDCDIELMIRQVLKLPFRTDCKDVYDSQLRMDQFNRICC